ncbi:MAG TPA: PAS domain S-box protein [Microvirga sp.]|jgi:PAS domain S-box-containing protein|nr:PAS domain S-box protein [Microvirga sp.]
MAGPIASSGAVAARSRRRLSLRARLVALVVAAVAPVLLFSVAMVWRLGQSESGVVEASLRQTARAVGLAVDREVGAAHAVLQVLAASPALQAGDLAAFHREITAAARVRGASIALADRGRRQILHTGRPYDPDATLPAMVPAVVERVFATGAPQVSDVFSGPPAEEPWAVAAVPVRDAAGEVTHVLGMAVMSARLSALLAEQGLARNWIAAVQDRNGLIVARSRDPGTFLGRPGSAALRERVLRGEAEGTIDNVTADGQPVVTTFARSPVTGWTVAVGVPREEATARIRVSLALAAGVGALLLGLAIAAATLAGRSIARPVARLAADAAALGAGVPLAGREPTAIPELEAVARSLHAAQTTVKTREADLSAATLRAERLAAERTAILGQLMEGVVVTDAGGRITYANEAACRLHGVARLEGMLAGDGAAYRFLTEEGEPYPPGEWPLARAVRGGETVADLRWQIRRPDGSTVLAIGSASPLRDAAGALAGAVLTLRDDTAREEAERLLRKREGELARVQRIGAVGGLEVDLRDGGFRNRRSPEYLRIHGLSEADAYETHENWVARIHADDRDGIVEHFRATLDGDDRDYEAEYRIIRPSDGVERWILAKAEIERGPDGRPLRLVGAHIDITERKRAELALEARTRELESVLATVPAGVWFTHDPAVGEVRRNRYAAELMRVPARTTTPLAAQAQREGGIRVLAEGREVAGDELPLQQAMRGVSTADWELTFRFPDGGERHLLSSATALRDETGAVVGAVSVALDITERKRAERHQRLLINELNHRVKNTLAIVQAVAAQTFKAETASAPARAAFEARLMALSRAHNVLTRESWEGAGLREIVEDAVGPHAGDRGPVRRADEDSAAPHAGDGGSVRPPGGDAADPGGGDGRFHIAGPDARVSPRVALALAMSLHELCTNAAKYGALSVPGGSVSILWSLAGGSGARRLHLRWEERGGPPVAPPARRGFGTRLIERQLAGEFDGGVRLDFAPAGVVCTIEARLDGEEPLAPPARAALTA